MQLVPGLNRVLSWYQKKIGACDKQPWEKTIEQRILRGFSNVPKKTGKIKTELIDVDLVRGSSFPKAKPLYAWTHITRKGLVRILLLPLFYSWWKQQTSLKIYLILLILYILQIFSIIIYFTYCNDNQEFEAISLTEVCSPSALMIILGTVHSQIVSTHFICTTKVATKAKRQKRTKRKPRKKKNSDEYESRSSQEAASDDKPAAFIQKTNSLRRNMLRLRQVNREKDKRHSSGSYTESASERGEEQIDGTLEERQLLNEEQEIKLNGAEVTSLLHHDSYFNRLSQSDNVENCKNLIDCGEFEHLDFSDDLPVVNNEALMDLSSQLQSQLNHSSTIHQETISDNLEAKKVSSLETSTLHTLSQTCISKLPSMNQECNNFVIRKQLSCSQLESHDLLGEAKPSLRVKRNLPESLRLSQVGRESSCNSSCDSEIDTPSPYTPTKDHVSELDWDDSVSLGMDGNTSDSSDSTQVTDHEIRLHEDPFAWETQDKTAATVITGASNVSDRGMHLVSCAIWEGNDCKKVDLSVLDISSAIIHKVASIPESVEYLVIGLLFACIFTVMPVLFRLNNARDVLHNPQSHHVVQVAETLMGQAFGSSWSVSFVVLTAMTQRFCLSSMFFFFLSVAERTFKQRFLYAKHFCQLTSVRRARKSELPHFRLNKVRNIKTWLSVRSYLKKRGPQRSVDVIVSAAFILALCLVSLMCVQLLKDTESFSNSLYNWELVGWSLALGLYLLRFMTLGSKINRKYRNLSVLITEQINLYLHMEQKPHKKEELMLANNVLKLAAELLKELESPFKISGISANSYLYNITKVVILSAFSAVLTEMLGFKLKLYKIKIK